MQLALNNGLIYWEEISTMFIIGFPGDIQERELQNVFTFWIGFEATVLKTPSNTGELIQRLWTTNYKKQIVSIIFRENTSRVVYCS